jgi:hypothetical protein
LPVFCSGIPAPYATIKGLIKVAVCLGQSGTGSSREIAIYVFLSDSLQERGKLVCFYNPRRNFHDEKNDQS